MSRSPFQRYIIRFLKFYIGFKIVTSEPLQHCDFVDPQCCSWRSHCQTRNNLDYLQLEIVKINPHRDKNLVVPTVCGFSNQTRSQLIHQRFGHVSITRLKRMARKGLMEGLPENFPELEEPCPICLLTKETKISRGPTTDVSKFTPGFMLQMNCVFFNVESIRWFTSTFVAICSATSYPFGFPSISKRPPHEGPILIKTRIWLSQLSVDFQINSVSTDSSKFWSRLNHSTKTNGKKRTHGRSS